MKVAEKNFREVYKKICLLENNELIEKINLREIFDFPPDEKLNGVITYAYINAENIFVFEILAGAKISGDKIKTFPTSYKKNISYSRADIENVEIKILSDDYKNAFQDKIQVIEDANKINSAIEKIRAAESLDELRHPNFPDDIAVLFYAENLRPEYAWVRCENIDDKFIVGTLLNNLQQNFDYRAGDKIKFGVADFEGEIICVVSEKFL